ncbi:integrase core domain-containing protein, partial [Promicromonospora citrea]
LAESFNATLKREVLQDAACWPDKATCRREVFRWILRYNNRRRHSWCGYTSPVDYEKNTTSTTLTTAA